jgi:dipeptidyl aminopeptidase/acylaminoacyl peptidase
MDLLPEVDGAERIQISYPGGVLGGYLFLPLIIQRRLPAVILLHGYSSNAQAMIEPARLLVQEGYAALALSMRGWPGSSGDDDCGLHQPDDIVVALEWLSIHPCIDNEHLGIFGNSQGGQVALLTAARSIMLRAVVVYKPVTDIDRWKTHTTQPGIPEYITKVCEPGGSRLRSPVDFAEHINAPVLLVHGDADQRVPTEQSQLMKQALEKFGKTVETRLIPGANHTFTREHHELAWPWTVAFFAKYLKMPY